MLTKLLINLGLFALAAWVLYYVVWFKLAKPMIQHYAKAKALKKTYKHHLDRINR